MRSTKTAPPDLDLLNDARKLLAQTEDYEAILARAGARDRTNVQRHVAVCDAEPEESHGRIWRRLFTSLATLAPLPVTTVGQQAVLFFVPDGKYRMQVFALEDAREGAVSVYMPDVLDAVVAQGVISPLAGDTAAEGARHYRVGHSKVHTLSIEPLSAATTPNPPAHVKNMIGWNRKGLRVALPIIAVDEETVAVELMAAIAALRWSHRTGKAE
jgi:hypothetical protein